MSLWQSFLEAIGSLSANKTRSSLTMLGIVIGVGAVIALMGLGEGTQASITSLSEERCAGFTGQCGSLHSR